jgi:hypothetical protein
MRQNNDQLKSLIDKLWQIFWKVVEIINLNIYP